MESYPAELVTPPLALVALLGSPELHAALSEFLRSHHKPPINSIGVADPLAVGRVFGEHGLILYCLISRMHLVCFATQVYTPSAATLPSTPYLGELWQRAFPSAAPLVLYSCVWKGPA